MYSCIETGLQDPSMQWNSDNSILAIGGRETVKLVSEDKRVNAIHLYNKNGQHLRSLRLQGKTLTSLSWDDTNRRLACAIDSYVYFANVHYYYNFTYLYESNTLVYTFPADNPLAIQNQENISVVFWTKINTDKDLINVKYVF